MVGAARRVKVADYVTNPTLPKVLAMLFGSANVVAPNAFPRADLVAAFLTGVPGVNELFTGMPATAEMLGLNVKDFGTPPTAGRQRQRRPGRRRRQQQQQRRHEQQRPRT